MSIQENIVMESKQEQNNENITTQALNHFKLQKHDNIKMSFIKKHKIIMEPRELLSNLCFIMENSNSILLDYRYFKCFILSEDYDNVFKYFYSLIEFLLRTHKTFNIHVYIKSLSMLDVDKYYTFISKISQIMKDAFPDKLGKCYIYNASFIFSQLIKIISKFVDKKTEEKILLIDE